jgi:hypothetical protein
MSLQAFNCTADVDPRLSLAEARRVLGDIKPRRLVAPTAIVDLLGSDCIGGPVLALSRGDVISLPIELNVERAYVDGALAASLTTTTIDSIAAQQLASDIDQLAQSAAAAPTQPVLFAPFNARPSSGDADELLLKVVVDVGGTNGATAPQTDVANKKSEKATQADNSTLNATQPSAIDVIDVMSQRIGPVSVRVGEKESGNARKRPHSERTEIAVDGLSATVTLDPDRNETTVQCNASASARELLVDALRAASVQTSEAKNRRIAIN